MKRIALTIALSALAAFPALAKVDLVTVPQRNTVQITIYNSADLTLVREQRALTLREGENRLQFSWANTLIDPTSLELLPKAQADRIAVFDLLYPPRTRNVGVWEINSEIADSVPVEITYLTSGISWRAFYMGTLSPDESTMRLQGYVRVTNNSGEDYEGAQTRLIVGRVHILDEIANLARREHPYGSPVQAPGRGRATGMGGAMPAPEAAPQPRRARAAMLAMDAAARPREITREGLSEYFLYTIEGTETIPNGWSKRLPSFDVEAVPVVNLYKYEEERYRNQVRRFLSFKNDEEHDLGDTPIPGGALTVYRLADEQQHLAYEGASDFQYIPVNEDVELDLGPVQDVIVEPTLMRTQTAQYRFDRDGDINGWDQIQTFRVRVKNTRPVAAEVEITRNFGTQYWTLEHQDLTGEYEKIDLDTARFTVTLEPLSEQEFTYVLTTRHGVREQQE